MSYATSDFTESLERVNIEREQIARVIAAWGHGDGMGSNDSQPTGWAEDSPTEWSGGFLVQLKDGRYAYIWGWCDYTGWGCQDGAYVRHYDTEPERAALDFTTEDRNAADSHPRDWDEEPADLNRWLVAERAVARAEEDGS